MRCRYNGFTDSKLGLVFLEKSAGALYTSRAHFPGCKLLSWSQSMKEYALLAIISFFGFHRLNSKNRAEVQGIESMLF